VSFGVASSEQAADLEATVTLADEALLLAKAAGRDRIVVAQTGGPAATSDDRPGPRPPAGPPVDAGRRKPVGPLVAVTPSSSRA
jgi:hypothetical protein